MSTQAQHIFVCKTVWKHCITSKQNLHVNNFQMWKRWINLKTDEFLITIHMDSLFKKKKKRRQEEGQRTFFMNHKCTELVHFLKYKVGYIKQVSSRPHLVSFHHHPYLQQFQVFKRILPWIWHFSSPKYIRFTCFQVQSDLVPNLVCWAELQYLVLHYHSYLISMPMLRAYTRVRKCSLNTL